LVKLKRGAIDSKIQINNTCQSQDQIFLKIKLKIVKPTLNRNPAHIHLYNPTQQAAIFFCPEQPTTVGKNRCQKSLDQNRPLKKKHSYWYHTYDFSEYSWEDETAANNGKEWPVRA